MNVTLDKSVSCKCKCDGEVMVMMVRIAVMMVEVVRVVMKVVMIYHECSSHHWVCWVEDVEQSATDGARQNVVLSPTGTRTNPTQSQENG